MVRVTDELKVLRVMQDGRGGWEDDMVETVGKTGIVTEVSSKGGVKAKIDGHSWMFNPLCLSIVRKADQAKALESLSTLKSLFEALESMESLKEETLNSDRFGEMVRVELTLDDFKLLQERHGGFVESMGECLLTTGVVLGTDSDGDIKVQYPSGRSWCLNPAAVTFLSDSSERESASDQSLSVGDSVRITEDEEIVQMVQEGNIGWVDSMRTSLGKTGLVEAVFSSGNVRVKVGEDKWTFSPVCLVKVTSAQLTDASVPKRRVDADLSTAVDSLARLLRSLSEADGEDKLDRRRFGQMVKVTTSLEVFKSLQEKHGGYNDSMKECLSSAGVVLGTDEDGDLKIQYPSGNSWCLNPAVVTFVQDSQGSSASRTNQSNQAEPFCCPICMDERIDRVFRCGHAVCQHCLTACLRGGVCPICRGPVDKAAVTPLFA